MYVQSASVPERKPVTVPGLLAMKAQGRRIVMLTAYDASFAWQLESAGIDIALVGDSLGMVVQGHHSTLPVTLAHMVYHTAAVARGLTATLLVADLPFMAERDTAHALEAGARLVGEAGAAMVKIEGAAPHILEAIAALTVRAIPVCAHLGLTPQSVHKFGGFRIQGRDQAAADHIVAEALAVQAAGAALLVLEGVPTALGARVTAALKIPVIGIGAGPQCDGQVLVIHDMLGITPGKRPKFSKDFLAGRDSVAAAIGAFAEDVRSGAFPAPEHCFNWPASYPAMQTVQDAPALRAAIRNWRAKGETVGFVPTMGNLHAGHQSLIRLARTRMDRVVASVFVNPTQFGPNEDFTRYPRTLTLDQTALTDEGCDLLFAPEVSTIYPFGAEQSVSLQVPQITAILEGAHRPGHFDGVATVVCKLFNLVQPDLVVFGQKDFQQLKVIERMVRDLSLPLKVMAAPTLRADDGLALSSRNQYLSTDERARAPLIHDTLLKMGELLDKGHAWQAVEQVAAARLVRAGFAPDYTAIRRAEDLAEPATGEHTGLIALVAARLGNTRLIDNLLLD